MSYDPNLLMEDLKEVLKRHGVTKVIAIYAHPETDVVCSIRLNVTARVAVDILGQLREIVFEEALNDLEEHFKNLDNVTVVSSPAELAEVLQNLVKKPPTH